MLSSHNSPIKYGPEIIALLEAVYLPKEVVVIHIKGHQKDMTLESKVNNLADHAAKEAAKGKQILSLIPVLTPMESITPVYSDQEIHIAQERGYTKNAQDWPVNEEGKFFMPKISQWKIIQGLHLATHLGKDTLKHLIKNIFDGGAWVSQWVKASAFGSGHDPRVLGSSSTSVSLLSGEPASSSRSACFSDYL